MENLTQVPKAELIKQIKNLEEIASDLRIEESKRKDAKERLLVLNKVLRDAKDNSAKEPSKDKKPKATQDDKNTEKDEYKVEVIKDWYGRVDPFYLSKKDPKYTYRFLRAEDKNLSIKTGNLLFQKGGWQIVPREHLVSIGIAERYIRADGVYRVGDTVLARIPKDLYNEKLKYKDKRAKEPMEAVTRLIDKGDTRSGGKEIHDSMKGIQTKKDLGM